MWFIASVLVVWITTAELARVDAWALSAITTWGWWTLSLYACGVAAATGSYGNLPGKAMGLLGYCLFVLYLLTQSGKYLAFVPDNSDHPNLWPMVFLTVNLLGPLLIVTIGLAANGMQRRG